MSGHSTWGNGNIYARGVGVWRLRYSIGGGRHTATFHGSKAEARTELRRLLHAGDVGEHVDPNRITLKDWIEHWLSIGCPGRRRREVSARSRERYCELLSHVLPILGDRPLQRLEASEIDALYVRLAEKLAPRTVYHAHIALSACLNAATRARKIPRNPTLDVVKVPTVGEADHGMALEVDQLRALLGGFKGSPLFAIVAAAAFTGARRNEILALQWRDLDVENKTLRIERAVEETDAHGLRLKAPKTGEKGKRTIAIDDDLIELLLAARERHLRIAAGVPDGIAVDLSLVKLPDGALMFPASPAPGEGFSFTKLRDPLHVTKAFIRRAARLGFPGLRFHDLRGSHETLLIDSGVPLHVVAARCGHTPAVLLRSYAKRTRKADTSAAAVIGALSRGMLK
jgi:integrase